MKVWLLLMVVAIFALPTTARSQEPEMELTEQDKSIINETLDDSVPHVYKYFRNPPFISKDIVYVSVNETASALNIGLAKALAIVGKERIVLSEYDQRGRRAKEQVIFAPAKKIAQALALDIQKKDNVLTVGKIDWMIDQKLIVIDRGNQQIHAFEGLKQVYQCRTCTGANVPSQDKHPTPIGIFHTRLKSPGKFVGRFGPMYWPTFFNGGIAIHNCPSDSNVKDRPDSHGCCRTLKKDNEWFWGWIPGHVPAKVKQGGLYFITKEDSMHVYVIP